LRARLARLCLPAPNTVGFRRREKDMIERAGRDEIDSRGAVRIETVNPAARYGAAKEYR
jgi:hypothetical protein